jgi:hypothetical protein
LPAVRSHGLLVKSGLREGYCEALPLQSAVSALSQGHAAHIISSQQSCSIAVYLILVSQRDETHGGDKVPSASLTGTIQELGFGRFSTA